MSPKILLAVSLALIVSTAASAHECKNGQAISLNTETATGIKFFNDTHYAMRIFWADFRGELKPMSDWIQPGAMKVYKTYAGHAWLVEVNAPEGRVCSGAIGAYGLEECGMHILFDHGLGYAGGACDQPS